METQTRLTATHVFSPHSSRKGWLSRVGAHTLALQFGLQLENARFLQDLFHLPAKQKKLLCQDYSMNGFYISKRKLQTQS